MMLSDGLGAATADSIQVYTSGEKSTIGTTTLLIQEAFNNKHDTLLPAQLAAVLCQRLRNRNRNGFGWMKDFAKWHGMSEQAAAASSTLEHKLMSGDKEAKSDKVFSFIVTAETDKLRAMLAESNIPFADGTSEADVQQKVQVAGERARASGSWALVVVFSADSLSLAQLSSIVNRVVNTPHTRVAFVTEALTDPRCLSVTVRNASDLLSLPRRAQVRPVAYACSVAHSGNVLLWRQPCSILASWSNRPPFRTRRRS